MSQVNPTYLFVWSASVSVYNRAADAARVVDVHWSELLTVNKQTRLLNFQWGTILTYIA